jgi:hypothetical protein
MNDKMKSWFYAKKLSVYHIAKVVNSYLHLYGHNYHQNRIYIDALAVSTTNVDNDPVALYWTNEAHRDGHNCWNMGCPSF